VVGDEINRREKGKFKTCFQRVIKWIALALLIVVITLSIALGVEMSRFRQVARFSRALTLDLDGMFEDFMETYSRTYQTREIREKRFRIFV